MVGNRDRVEILAAGHLELPADFNIVAATAIGRHPLNLRAELLLSESLFEGLFEGLGSRSVGSLEGTSDESNLHDDFSKFPNKRRSGRVVARCMARPMFKSYLTNPVRRERIRCAGPNGPSIDSIERNVRALGFIFSHAFFRRPAMGGNCRSGSYKITRHTNAAQAKPPIFSD